MLLAKWRGQICSMQGCHTNLQFVKKMRYLWSSIKQSAIKQGMPVKLNRGGQAGWKSRRFNIGFAGGATISQGMWVASRSWEWPRFYNQNELNSASMSMSGSRFSPQPLEKSPGWLTPLFWPLEISNRVPSWARQDFCLKNLGIINGYCFKLLNLWRFVMATTEN